MERFEVFRSILADRLDLSRAVLLDFGCGSGQLVRTALARNIDAYGCDIDFSRKWRTEAELADLLASGRVRQITGANDNESPEPGEAYRLPFDDDTFDVVVSDNVMEHVRNYPDAISEFRRVLSPGGVMLHMFPSRYRLVEPHVYVPLASFFRPYWWLRLWAACGVRNEFQKDLDARQTANFNQAWLGKHTNYMTLRELHQQFEPSFSLDFAEGEFMRLGRAKSVLFPALYRAFFSRIMVAVRSD